MNKSTIILIMLAALGIGALIGTNLVEPEPMSVPEQPAALASVPTQSGGAPLYRFLAPGDVDIVVDAFGNAEPSTLGENYIDREGAWKNETIVVELEGDGSVEYKVLMKQGDSLVFNWSTDGGQTYFDFHAHDAAFGDKFFTRYKEGEGTASSGSFVAAYDGQHGWFWLNLEPEPVSITLSVAGFFDEIVRIGTDKYPE